MRKLLLIFVLVWLISIMPAPAFADAVEPVDLPVITQDGNAGPADAINPMEPVTPDTPNAAENPDNNSNNNSDKNNENNADNSNEASNNEASNNEEPNNEEPAPSLPDTLEVWVFDPQTNGNVRTTVVPVYLTLKGAGLASDVPAMASQGRTLVPVRIISENLNAEVKWDKATNTVTITQGEEQIVLTIGSSTAYVNGEEKSIPGEVSVGLVTYEGAARTMVPVRFVSENLAATINYDQATRVVDIIPPAPEPEENNNNDNNNEENPPEPEPEPDPPGIDANGRLYRRVVIDAGHGGQDPGATGGGHWEKTINLAVAQKTQAQLEAAGFEVIMARSGDDYVSLTDRANLTLEQDAPVFVSIHCNSADKITTASGIETYAAPEDAEDARLAGFIQKELIAATDAKNRGVKESRLVVLTHNLAPACLVEIGFLTNQAECARLWDPAYQQKLAVAITRGVEAYFAARDAEPPVELKNPKTPTEAATNTSDLLPFTK